MIYKRTKCKKKEEKFRITQKKKVNSKEPNGHKVN